MCVHDIYKNVGTYCVSGRIETGFMNVGNKVSIQPKGEVAVIKSKCPHLMTTNYKEAH